MPNVVKIPYRGYLEVILKYEYIFIKCTAEKIKDGTMDVYN